ncbi:MAG TPA: TIGR00730 family Rossman fold protein [Burkholderiaceae bacterium]|nr:TIGR00730 family Rossman fold protein [Burkholderiaceae bacterium]
MKKTLSICVYCGSRPGAKPEYADAARAIGAAIGERGWQLVYGGGRAGLMGIVADAALAAGAPVVGVIPESLMGRELGHRGLTELHVVQTMHERKLMMAERSDAFIALPGGIGTFEELFEVWSWRQLGYHDKPLGLLNIAGYYDTLLEFLRNSERLGLMTNEQLALLQVSDAPLALLAEMGRLAPLATAPDDYRQI